MLLHPPEEWLSDLVVDRFVKTSVAFAVHNRPLFGSKHRQGMAGVNGIAFSASKLTLVFAVFSAAFAGEIGDFLKFHGGHIFLMVQ